MKKALWFFIICVISAAVMAGSPGYDDYGVKLKKTAGHEDRKEGILDGNRISTLFYNFGAIGDWQNRRYESGIYPKGANGHSYFAEFTPVVGAEVVDRLNIKRHIFSDGASSTNVADNRPTGGFYAFEPLSGYADKDQKYIAVSDALDKNQDGKPDSWPWRWPDKPTWFNPATGIPYWNGQYGAYVRADQEAFFKMNDYYNDEFRFWPSSTDTTMRGLGVELAVRGYQWAHPAAEDLIIWTYWVTNTGTTNYNRTVFGMYGDSDIGDDGDQKDDDAFFNKTEDIVYQWDHDNRGSWGGPCAYFGFRYLESPGDPLNKKDDDEDGMIDESQANGIDDDKDWNVTLDDVGLDGLAPGMVGYPGPDKDGSEGNGKPDANYALGVAEPNFEMSDNHESDQLGLTSFKAAAYPGILLDTDENVWAQTVPGNFDAIEQTVDLTFLYATAYFQLPPLGDPNNQRKFAIALVLGEDYDDLLRNSKTMQKIYDADYNFAKPPEKPVLTAVPGDHRVTLYWDKRSEELTRDPIYGNDLEGYMIFRSTDAGFTESYVITNAYGNKTFDKPIAQFDKKNSLKGPHPLGLDGLQLNMGDDTGLTYTWTDTTVQNGQTYYYAVCAYDQGYDSDFYERKVSAIPNLLPIAPSICSKRIRTDIQGKVVALDMNTAMAVPNAPAAGYIAPSPLSTSLANQTILHSKGNATGRIEVYPLDPMKIRDQAQYKVVFDDTTYAKSATPHTVFSILDKQVLTQRFVADTVAVQLNGGNLDPASVQVKDPATGQIFAAQQDYRLNARVGTITMLAAGKMRRGVSYEVQYQYYPVYQSEAMAGQDTNPYFDGLRVLVYDHPLDPDTLKDSERRAGWFNGKTLQLAAEKYKVPFDDKRQICNYSGAISMYAAGGVKTPVPYDYHVVVFDKQMTKSFNGKAANFLVFNATTGDSVKFVYLDVDPLGKLSDQDAVVPLLNVAGKMRGTWQVKFWTPPDSLILDIKVTTFVDSLGVRRVQRDTTIVGRIPKGIAPQAGDVFNLAVRKPFVNNDVYEFTAQAPYVDKKKAGSDSSLDRIAVVPNPYVVTAEWEPQHVFKSGRGERKIDFIHLPARCTIKIFTIRGYLVNTIDHDALIDDGSESWNLLSKDGMDIAYGIYIFHVDAPGIGSKIGKFGVIK